MPNRYTPAILGYPHKPLRAKLTQSTLLNEAEVISLARECESYVILHTALVRALCSLQRDPSKGVSNSAHHNSPAGITKDRYTLRRRYTLARGQYKDCSDADTPSIVDDHSCQSDVDTVSSTDVEDETLGDEKGRQTPAMDPARGTSP